MRATKPDPLIDGLVADLGAVRPRRWTREAALLLGLVAAELAAMVIVRGMRPDMPQVMMTPNFWWKSGGLALIGIAATAAALVSVDPATTASRPLAVLRRGLGLAIPALLGLGWLLDAGAGADADSRAALIARLAWRDGIDCLFNIALLSLPIVIALAIILRRGAPTLPSRSAGAAGLAAAGIAAWVFAFYCDHDDPLYVAVWYGAAVLGVAGLTRLVLPRLIRW